jgi:hypothetical protein
MHWRMDGTVHSWQHKCCFTGSAHAWAALHIHESRVQTSLAHAFLLPVAFAAASLAALLGNSVLSEATKARGQQAVSPGKSAAYLPR